MSESQLMFVFVGLVLLVWNVWAIQAVFWPDAYLRSQEGQMGIRKGFTPLLLGWINRIRLVIGVCAFVFFLWLLFSNNLYIGHQRVTFSDLFH